MILVVWQLGATQGVTTPSETSLEGLLIRRSWVRIPSPSFRKVRSRTNLEQLASGLVRPLPANCADFVQIAQELAMAWRKVTGRALSHGRQGGPFLSSCLFMVPAMGPRVASTTCPRFSNAYLRRLARRLANSPFGIQRSGSSSFRGLAGRALGGGSHRSHVSTHQSRSSSCLIFAGRGRLYRPNDGSPAMQMRRRGPSTL